MNIRDCTSTDVRTTSPQEAIPEAARTMKEADTGALPVLNRDKPLVGTVSLGDISQTGDGLEGAAALSGVSQRDVPHKHA